MTDLSQKILSDYQIRKTKKQKQAFITFLRSSIPELTIQKRKSSSNQNLIIGDVERASIILSAHYDTCAQMPIPNFITPLNPLLSIAYSFILVIPMFLIVFLLNLLLGLATDDFWIHYCLSLIVLFALMWLMVAGPANKHTVNDNTSGVITLCEIYAQLSEDQKQKVAFVFFDNEEKGLIGSSAFRKQYKKLISGKLLINFDCVSDGDNLLLAVSKKAQHRYGSAIEQAFASTDEKNVMIKNAEKTYYPSDQAGFPLSVAVAALNHKKVLGYYMDKIHTKKDTVMDSRNITYLRDGIIKLLDHI